MIGLTFLHEFRKFISRGNVLDLAVAVIMGAAFTAIVNSVVKDIIAPIIGIFLGGVDFDGLSITVGNAVIKYGSFIQATINFLITAFVIFLIINTITKLQEKFIGKTDKEVALSKEVKLLTEIRDSLKK